MDRRHFLGVLASSGTLLTAGCLDDPFSDESRDEAEVFASHRYEGTDLVVVFEDEVSVEELRLRGGRTVHERVERPVGEARLPVVFPGRLETHIPARPPLHVEAVTEDGTARLSVWDVKHGRARNVRPAVDGRARFQVENTGGAPLLLRYVSIDFDSYRAGPGVVGVGENSAQHPDRTDLVVPAGEQKQFESTHKPFAAAEATGTESERTGMIALVLASGSIHRYSFSYQL